MFSNIKVGDYVLVAKEISFPYTKEVVCEVNDTTFKCKSINALFSKTNGMGINRDIFPYAQPYNAVRWKDYCKAIALGKRKQKALHVIKDFCEAPLNSVEKLEEVAEFISKINER